MSRFFACVLLLVCLSLAFDEPAISVAATQEEKRADLYGDPLPAGAIARMGTMRLRHVAAAALALTPDGKSLVTVGEHKICYWDLTDGRLLREQPLPVAGGFWALSADARLLASPQFQKDAIHVHIWDLERNESFKKIRIEDVKSHFHQALFSPDGKTLVAAEKKGTLHAWDVASGKEWSVGKHEDQAWSLHFIADGSLVTTCRDPKGDGRILRLWDVANGRERLRTPLPEHASEAFVSPDGRITAIVLGVSGKRPAGVQFLDIATGEPAKGWIGPSLTPVYWVQFDPTGTTVAISTDEGVVIWDPSAGKRLQTLPGGHANRLTYSRDGKTLTALRGSWSWYGWPWTTAVLVWDVSSGKARAAAESGHLDEIAGVALSPDGRTVASISKPPYGGAGTLSVWNATTGRLRYALPAQNINFRPLLFSPDSKDLFVGSSLGVTRLDAATGREIHRYLLTEEKPKPGERQPYMSFFHLTEDGRKLIGVQLVNTAYDPSDGSSHQRATLVLHAWDIGTGKRLEAPTFTVEGPGTDFAGYGRFSADGRLLAIPGGHIRDTTTGRELGRLTIDGKPSSIAAFSRDNALVAAADDHWRRSDKKKTVQVWETETLLPVARLETDEVAHLAFTPDGRGVIAAGLESLQLWDIASEKPVASHAAHERFRGVYGPSFVSAFALGADGHTLATGHKDTTVLLWNLSAPARKMVPLSAKELESCWDDLAGADGRRAMIALARLCDEPGPTLKLLGDRLRPVQPAPPEELRKLIADLQSAEFKLRAAAAKRLAQWGELAETALKKVLRGQPSLETHRRIEELLAMPRTIRDPEVRRALRAIRILEQIPAAEATSILESIAQGAPDARVTKEARASVERLRKVGSPAR